MFRLLAKLRALFRREKLDRDMAEEIRFHLEERAADNLADGLPPDEAHYAAQRKFGGVEQIKERARAQRGLVWLEQFRQDVGFAVRSLRKNPVFAAVTLTTLGLGIGATTAIFTLIDAIYLQPLPVKDPHRLVMLIGSRGVGMFSVPNFTDLRDRTDAFLGLAASRWVRAELEHDAEKSQIGGLLVSAAYFSVLGLDPIVGRTFSAEDMRPSAPPVIVLSESAWRRRFASHPTIIGRSVRLNGIDFQVVGVVKGGFSIEGAVDPEQEMWLPMRPGMLGETRAYFDRDSNWVWLHGRLKPGVSRSSTQAAIEVIARQLERDYPVNAGFRISVLSELEWRLRRHPASFYAMLVALVLSVLLIAGANVANLLLARAVHRSREIAMRAALGAVRARLIRQLLAESLLLGALGGATGLLAGHWVLAGFTAFAPGMIGVQPESLHLNGRVLGFTVGLSLVVGVLAGLFPALHVTRVDLVSVLQRRSAAGLAGFSFKRFLIVLQVALSFVLLVSTGLFVRTLQRIWHVDLGYRTEKLVWLGLDLRRMNPTEEASRLTFSRLRDVVGMQPLVEAAGFGPGPFPSFQWTNVVVGDVRDLKETHHAVAGPGYFGAMGIVVLRGREFNAGDHPTAPPVAIVNEAMAQRFWPGGNALSAQFRPFPGSLPVEIVGIVRTVRETPWRLAEPLFYLPISQRSSRSATLAVRVRDDPATARLVLPAQLSAIEPGLIANAATFHEVMQEKLSGTRFRAGWLLLVLTVLGVLLASVGLYGVIAYSVAQKTREIGIRLALGASPTQVRLFVVSDSFRLVVIGTIIGAMLSLASTRLVQGLIIGSALDPLTFIVVAMLLIMIGMISSYVPARRAAKIDPMIALCCE